MNDTCVKCGGTRGMLIHKVTLYESDPWLPGVDEVHEFVSSEFPAQPRTDEIASGVEGAHEGTTAEKSVALAESSLSSPSPAKEKE